MRLTFPNFGRAGINKDLPAYELPAEFLSDGNNIILRDGRLRSAPGYEETFSGASVGPFFALPIDEFWVYAGQDKIYCIDNNSTHTNITRQDGVPADVDYTGSEVDIWDGCVFNGIPILNNGVDAPQYWALPLSTSTKMADLPYDAGNSWDDLSYNAHVIKQFRNYLVALAVQKATYDPYMVKWSDGAVPGSLPADWDETDDTIEAGEFSLTEGDDIIIDGMQTGRHFVIYKERSTWLMRHIGGGSIMTFDKLFNRGILARRCMCHIGGSNSVVVSEDDIYLHDVSGGAPRSIVNNTLRRWFTTNLDTANFRKTHCAYFPHERQVWVAFPESGQSTCTKAMIWHTDTQAWTIRDLPNIEHLAIGVTDSETNWEDFGTLTWEELTIPWDQSGSQGKSQIMLMLDGVNDKFFLNNAGEQDDGVSVRKYMERQSIPLQRNGDQGGVIFDLESVWTVTRIFPKMRVEPVNTDMSIYLGTQMLQGDSVTWSSEYTFNPSTDNHLDVLETGRFLSVIVEATDDVSFFLDGLDIEYMRAGLR